MCTFVIMVLIPSLEHRSIINQFVKSNKVSLSKIEILHVMNIGGGHMTTSQVFYALRGKVLYKRWLNVNDYIVEMLGEGYIKNSVIYTSSGRKRYRYHITSQGVQLLHDFNSHCEAWMRDNYKP